MSTIKAKYVSAPVNGATVEPLVVQTNNLDRVTVDSSGNVGIGTSSPAVKCSVIGGTTSGGVDDVALFSGGAAGVSGSGAAIYLTSNGSVLRAAEIAGVNTGGANGAHAMTFSTSAGSAAPTERARIDSSGNLLVGTTSSGGVGFTVGVDGAGRILTSNVSVVPFDVYLFKNNGTTVGKITINTSSTSYTTTSDYRLKEDVQPMTGALARISALKPVTYKWKIDGSAGEGFIAHELAEVVPDAVTGEKDAVNEDGSIKPQGIDTSFLVATLTAAIQELKAELDITKAKVAALEAA